MTNLVTLRFIIYKLISMKFMRFTLTGFMLLVTMAITAQTMVKGVVTSADDGEPLIGVTVLVKGTSSGTATDLDGRFE
jgi:iron complex outermembrane receptor protein